MVDKEDEIRNPRDIITSMLKLPTVNIPSNYSEFKRYSLNPPFCEAVIARNNVDGDLLYIVDEMQLTSEEKEGYVKLREFVEHELDPPSEEGETPRNYHRQLMGIVDSHNKLFEGIPSIGVEKIMYYLERDILGFGTVDPLMHDLAVEDISCSGVNRPIFVWHKEFDTLKTNLIFTKEMEIEDFVMKQVHRAGKHTSAAFPLTDVTLPGKHRLAIYYRKEVTLFGTSFTIRKFREDPLTVIDLVEMGTIDETVATYFWLLMENKLSMMVLGSTGAGKTTTLNAICCLIQPTNKICSIEEVSEINLPHENWVALISRSGFGLESQGEITLFDLVKSSLRHRPDFIVVGEVRGEESYVLFQALATGHGGLCTMHADNVNSAIKRLVQKPMDIAPDNIPLMNCAAVVKKVRLLSNESSLSYLGSGRRMVQVSEITGPDTVRDIFTWNPVTDTFEGDIMSSQILHKIATDNGFTREELLDEFERRKVVIGWMTEKHIRDFRSVSRTLAAYYRDPESIFEKAADSLGL